MPTSTNRNSVEIDRNEFAEIMNLWAEFTARVLLPFVKTDPHRVSTVVRHETRKFVTAVCTATDNAFLREHADDFAKALQEGTFGESLRAALRKQDDLKGKEPPKPIKIARKGSQPIRVKVPDGVGQDQRTLTLKRPK